MLRWWKFNAVGAVGVAVQLGALALLIQLGVNYLVATALAVEAAVLQNYYWHLANGLLSLISNLVWMRIVTGGLGIPAVPANLLAIALTSTANFLLGDRWVFARKSA